MEVTCIHRGRSEAILEDGQVLPVTQYCDSFGEECDGPEAVSCVAGPDKDGLWVSIDLTAFDGVWDH